MTMLVLGHAGDREATHAVDPDGVLRRQRSFDWFD